MYFKIAWRNFRKHPLNPVINILGLTLGITACIVIYLIIRYEFSFDAFHPAKNRIYRIGASVRENDGNQFSSTAFDESIPSAVPKTLLKEIPGIDAVAGFFPYHVKASVRQNDNHARNFDDTRQIVITGPEWFSIFQYNWLSGRPALLERPFSVILSESKARKYFGSISLEKMIGKEIIYEDSLRVNVVGIIKDWNKNTDFPYTDFISISTIATSFLKNSYHPESWHFEPGIRWISAFVKLSPRKDRSQFAGQMSTLVNKHFQADSLLRLIKFSLQLQPLSDIHFNAAYNHDGIRKAHLPTMYGLMGTAIFILLIAAINFINLSTAQSVQQSKNISLRKLLGSSRAALLAKFISETFLLSLLAVCIALLLINPVLTGFRDFIPPGVVFHPLQPAILIFILLITLITSLLSGVYPAWLLSAIQPLTALRGMAIKKKPGSGNLRKALIIFQFTVSIIFIVCSIVVRYQIQFVLKADAGFNAGATITVTNWNDPDNKMHLFGEKLKQLRNVEQTALQAHAPMGDAIMEFAITYKDNDNHELMVSMLAATNDFIPLYRMKLLAGRNLRKTDSLKEYIINETYSKALGFTNPSQAIGKLLYWNGRPNPVVGVVADFHQASFHESIRPLVIGHIPQFENSMGIRLTKNNSANFAATIFQIEQAWKQIYPSEPFQFRFLDQSIEQLYKKDQQLAWLITIAMMVAIFISCMGLFGLIHFTAQQRTKEIGIRKVLGANVSSIVRLLSTDLLKLVLISIIIASPIAWFFTYRWLQNFAYRIAISWWMFALGGLAAIAIACGTISFQAMKAAMVNPIKSLRAE